MSDFFNSTVAWVIAGVTLFSVIICGVFLWIQANKKVKVSLNEQTNSTGHVWDEDLKELNNPMPRWWMVLFYLTIVFSLGYLYFYPGLAVYEGQADWSSAEQYRAEKAALEEKVAPLYEQFDNQSLVEIARNEKALNAGKSLFLNNCAQCHGSDARGSKGFPNLANSYWQYGGEPADILTSIIKGRHGVMPPMMQAVGGSEQARSVAQYVLSLSGKANDSLRAQFGRDIYNNHCVACHGPNGQGNKTIGAPNLSDPEWVYGGTETAIVKTIREGRAGKMPAHNELLTHSKARVLAGYVWSLSNPNLESNDNIKQ